MQKNPIRIIVADDHEIVRDGLRELCNDDGNIQLVGEARDGKQLLILTESMLPDIVLTDIKMPCISGIDATKIITDKFPSVSVIVLSTFNDNYYVREMLDAGAKGFLLKDAPGREILEAIYSVYDDHPYFCKSTRKKVAEIQPNYYRNGSIVPIGFLTKREREIMRLICTELSTKEISHKLLISKRTIDGHRERIMQKIGAQNIAGIVTYAIRHGIYFELNDI